MRQVLAALTALALGAAAPLPEPAAQPISRGPMLVEIRTGSPPQRARTGYRDYLVYELHLTNFVPGRSMTIDSVTVTNSDTGVTLATLTGAGLKSAMQRIGAAAATDTPAQLASGQRGLVFMWVPVGSNVKRIRHTVSLHLGGIARQYVIDDRVSPVEPSLPIVIRAPLRGGPWVVANGPDPVAPPAHNRLLYPDAGAIYVPQRYATDCVLLNRNGRMYDGPASRNESYAGYGAAVVAVADGRVAAVHDGVAENIPPEVNADLAQPDRAGNYVVLDIGAGRFAFYGHLRPGSIRVALGQAVRCGGVLGQVGNSGNSTGAHLHFHVTDGASLASSGIPFVFANYADRGPLNVALDALETGASARPGPTRPVEADLPLGGRIVDFPADRAASGCR